MLFARVGFGRVVCAVLSLLLAAGLFGCGGEAAKGAVEVLAQRFPAQAGRVLGGVEPFVAQAGGLGLPSTPGRDGLAVTLPARGGEAVRLTTRQGLGVRVREVGAALGAAAAVSGAAVDATGTAVAYPGQGRTGFWAATARGVEEWLSLEADQVRADAPVAAWEVEGASVRLAQDMVELCDAEGVARVRVTAREAYGAGGRSVGVRLGVTGSRIELWVEASGEAVLVDPEWSSTGNMVELRRGHTATLLPDGRVLVAGGTGNGVLRSAELYDPKSGVWSKAAGDMTSARSGHTATLLPNGKVLVAGGWDGSDSSSAEIFDPATEMWSPTGNMTSWRASHTATLLPNGKVLVAGGDDASAELFDPATGSWTKTGPVTSAHFKHTATLLPNGKVLVVGHSEGNNPLDSAELFDPATGSWTKTGDMTSIRIHPTATLLPNGKVLVAGSLIEAFPSAELFDPATESWTKTSAMTSPRIDHTATLLPNGKVLIAGGSDDAWAELFDPATGSWTKTGNMTYAHFDHTATLLPNGKVLLTGAFGNELYDPAFSIWHRTASDMTSARYWHTATQLPNGKVLVAGGCASNNNNVLDTAELFDPATGSWTKAGSMSYPRYYHTATLLPNGKVLVAGGWYGGLDLYTEELFDPATGSWTKTSAMNYLRSSHTATLLPNGKVLVAGGFPEDAPAELFDPDTGTWSNSVDTIYGIMQHTATLLLNGKVLVAGRNVQGPAAAKLYDMTTGMWSNTGTMTSERSNATATLLPNGNVLVTGGGDVGFYSTAEVYDPATGTWSLTGTMTSARSGHTATLLDADAHGIQRVLMTGGQYPFSAGSAEMYDPTTGKWQEVSPMRQARWFHTATKLSDGRVLVVGGLDEHHQPLASAELYVRSSNGTSCLYDGDCLNGVCTDGVCCDTACPHDGCHACSLAAGALKGGECHTFTDDFLCNDNDACTAVDTCQAGSCVGAPQKVCPGLADDCHTSDVCNKITGQCEHVPVQDGTFCSGDKCTSRAVCLSGTCAMLLPRACPCYEPGTCDPAVGCEGGVPITCANNLRCDLSSGCLTACASVTDCLDGFVCAPSGQCILPPPRQDRDDAGCTIATRPAMDDNAMPFAALGLLLTAALAPLRRRRRAPAHQRSNRAPTVGASVKSAPPTNASGPNHP